MVATTGIGLFLHLTDKSLILKNAKNDTTRNFIKGTLRFVVASLALVFFARAGIYFNLALGVGKAVLGTLHKRRIFMKFRKEYLREAKCHFIKIILDLAVVIFKSFVIALYAISPKHFILLKNDIEKKLINQNIAK